MSINNFSLVNHTIKDQIAMWANNMQNNVLLDVRRAKTKIFDVEFKPVHEEPWGVGVNFSQDPWKAILTPGGQASRLGLQHNDIILAVNGVVLDNTSRQPIKKHLIQGRSCNITFMREFFPGDEVIITHGQNAGLCGTLLAKKGLIRVNAQGFFGVDIKTRSGKSSAFWIHPDHMRRQKEDIPVKIGNHHENRMLYSREPPNHRNEKDISSSLLKQCRQRYGTAMEFPTLGAYYAEHMPCISQTEKEELFPTVRELNQLQIQLQQYNALIKTAAEKNSS